MSRCFPYPPPGYSRNGATYEALIESIKLQKENDKAKAERKKEKKAKKEKKEKKEKRKDSTKSKLQAESQQDPHKQLQTSATIKKKQDPAIEQQLERSDLTEEHGQPVDSNKPSYSSDSTQNSNKRKRDDLVVPDESNPVKSIKIRLLKKQKGPDSIKETSCSNSGRIDECTNGGINVPLVQRTPLVSSNRRTTTSHDRKQQPVPVPVPVSFPPKKNDVAVLQSSEQQSIPIPSYRRPEPQIPTLPPSVVPSVSRNKNDATMVSSSGRKPIDEIKLPAVNNEKKKDPITLTKSEKKMMKKHSKYEKLIGGWVPPVLEPQVVPGDDDDDWLKGSGKTTSGARSSMVDDVEMCREMMWQPCARFLVEADVYALPYTVPF